MEPDTRPLTEAEHEQARELSNRVVDLNEQREQLLGRIFAVHHQLGSARRQLGALLARVEANGLHAGSSAAS